MTKKSKRIMMILVLFFSVTLGVVVILLQFKDNIIFFYSPTELSDKKLIEDKVIRVGGLIKKDSIKKDGENLSFIITDFDNEILIQYRGLAPNMFRESQGMVAKGKMINEIFVAQELLTKHDEKYMPREVNDILKKKEYNYEK